MAADLERLAEVSRLVVEARRERDALLARVPGSLRELARVTGLSVEGVRKIKAKGAGHV